MTHTCRLRIAWVPVALALGSFGAAAISPARAQCLNAGHLVIVNRKAVHSEGSRVLLELLVRHGTPARLGLLAASPDRQPVVIIDGVLADGGTQVLADLPSLWVDSVTVLRAVDAVWRYGPRAGHGAILVTTRSGRAQDQGATRREGGCPR